MSVPDATRPTCCAALIASFDRRWEATCETNQRVDERAVAVIDSTRLQERHDVVVAEVTERELSGVASEFVEQSAERCEPVRRRTGQAREAVVDVAVELVEHLTPRPQR